MPPNNNESLEKELAEVGKRASVCVACGLSKTRKNVVFGEGNPRSPLVLVGEGPGENEDNTGRPFVGRAGALLDKALRQNGLSRNDVYICNIVKCRPTLLEAGRVKNRPPSAEETQACSPWLDSQLTLIKPNVILCLGSPAAVALIKKGFKISQERGQFFTGKYAPHVIAAFHPAFILRQMGDSYERSYGTLVEDLGKAWSRAQEAPPDQPTEQQPSLF